jgi:hypothetical protein
LETIADIDQILASTQVADPGLDRWHTVELPSLGSSRILLSRSAEDRPCVFIQGTLSSFGRLPPLPSLEHRENSIDADTLESFPALRISAPNGASGRIALAHIVYELAAELSADERVDNSSLLNRVSWILDVLGKQGAPLSHRSQRGLLAECLLLRRMLERALTIGISPERVIELWVSGRRDFSGNGIAIEVKSTAMATRRHHIGSIDQLEQSDNDVDVYLYSIGILHESSSNSFLPDYVQSVEDRIVDSSGSPLSSAVQAFRDKLSSVGYHSSHDSLYRSGDGIIQRSTLPPRLFHVDSLDRLTLENFVDDQLPPGVIGVSYELEISADPIAPDETLNVLDRMIAPMDN